MPLLVEGLIESVVGEVGEVLMRLLEEKEGKRESKREMK